MNAFAPVEVLGSINSEFLAKLKGEVKENTKKARGPPKRVEGKASAEFGEYTKEQYESFGWVRENNILSAGYWKNFTENFAQAVASKYYFPKTKNGEFMIEVYDVYDNDSVADVIVFASGTIENPNVTKVVKIDLIDDTDIETKRRMLYEIERRGIQQKAGELFRFYYKTDFNGEFRNKGIGNEGNGNNHRLNAKRRSSEVKVNRIVKFHVDEDNGTITTTYADGETVTENLGRGKASQDLEFVDFLNQNAENRVLSDRELLAQALESEDLSPSEKGFLTKYKNSLSKIEANEAEIEALTAELEELRTNGKGDGIERGQAGVLEDKRRAFA